MDGIRNISTAERRILLAVRFWDEVAQPKEGMSEEGRRTRVSTSSGAGMHTSVPQRQPASRRKMFEQHAQADLPVFSSSRVPGLDHIRRDSLAISGHLVGIDLFWSVGIITFESD